MGKYMCMYNKCTPTGECAEVEFEVADGVPLSGPISVGPDDHIYMADYDPTNDDELGLFRCLQDALCEHISILDWPKDALEGGAWSYHDDLVKYGFSIGRNGGFYSFSRSSAMIMVDATMMCSDSAFLKRARKSKFDLAQTFTH